MGKAFAAYTPNGSTSRWMGHQRPAGRGRVAALRLLVPGSLDHRLHFVAERFLRLLIAGDVGHDVQPEGAGVIFALERTPIASHP
jgi:hypothetical protein